MAPRNDEEMIKFKKTVTERYDPTKTVNDKMYCMGLGKRVTNVIIAHIMPRRIADLASDLEINTINDPLNALMLYAPIERAFDNLRVCIELWHNPEVDEDNQEMRFTVLDSSLLEVSLVDSKMALEAKEKSNQTEDQKRQ